MEKRAYYFGKIAALHSLGFSENQIKTAFMQEGLPHYTADALVKEAAIPGLGALASGAARLFGRGAAALGRGAKSMGAWAGKGAAKGTSMGNLQSKAGIQARKATTGLQRGLEGLETAPLQTLSGGAKNFGSGLLMGGGKGVGGTLGKGLFAANTAAAFMPRGDVGQYGQGQQ